MAWRVAKSLEVLRNQINVLAPNRSRVSDGTIGDTRHAAGYSEHNPDGDGVVRAMDITHSPDRGLDCQKIVDALVSSRDTRIFYIIWNHKIMSPTIAPFWGWRPYRGSNPHDHHFHISVVANPDIYDKQDKWDLDGVPKDAGPAVPAPVEKPLLMRGSKGEAVKELQTKLGFTGKDVDGDFGPKTEAAVRAFQTSKKLVVDAKVGFYTWRALDAA